MSLTKFNDLNSLKNAVYKHMQFKGGGYLIVEYPNGRLEYFRTTKQCAKTIGISDSMIRKNCRATKEIPYVPTKINVKIYRSNEYIPIEESAVPIEESLELQASKIGESLTLDNTEVTEKPKEPSVTVQHRE